jgi:hypothetical protein
MERLIIRWARTCYVLELQPDALRQKTLETLKTAPFNKMRMCVFPRTTASTPIRRSTTTFVGNEQDGFDLARFNTKHGKRWKSASSLCGILALEADIILFHPMTRAACGFWTV